MKVGLFLHFDFTVNGMLFNELETYNVLFDSDRIEKIYIFDYKGKYSRMCQKFDFEYTRVIVDGYQDVGKFSKADVILTWDSYQDLFGGIISKKALDIYRIFSGITNDLEIKMCFRICDFRHYMRDYRDMILERSVNHRGGEKFCKMNKEHLHDLDEVKKINYDNVYFMCNGSKTINDWSWITLTSSMPFLSKEHIKDHTFYVSDDILFRYNEYYDKFKGYDGDYSNKKFMLYQVGNLNQSKGRKIRKIMENSNVRLFLRTSVHEPNDKVRGMDMIDLVEDPLYGDSMYDELHGYLAYLFVGNGDKVSRYFNKTMYDASIGRTVFLIYRNIDRNGIYKDFEEYMFDDGSELMEKMMWLKNSDYEMHLKNQREMLLKNLSKNDFFDFLDI